MMNFALNKKNYTILCIVVLILAALLRFYNLGGTDLWYDEALYANYSTGSFADFLRKTKHENSSPIALPLLYFILGDSIRNPFWIRFLPAMFSLGAVFVLLLMPRVGLDRRICLIAAFMCAISTVQIQYAQEVREYSLGVFGSAMCLYAFFMYINQRTIWPVVLVAFIVPFLSHGTVFLVVALGAVLVYLSLKRANFDYKILIAAVAFFISCFISFFSTSRFQFNHTQRARIEKLYPPEDGDLLEILISLAESLYSTFSFNLGNQYVIFSLLLALSCFIWLHFIWVFKNLEHRKYRIEHLSFLVLVVLLAIQITLSMTRTYPMGGIRNTIYIAPLIYFCIAIILNYLLSFWRTNKAIAALSIFSLVFFSVYNISAMPKAWQEKQSTAKLLEEHVNSDDMSNVYVYYRAIPAVKFHFPDFPGFFGGSFWGGDAYEVLEDIMAVNLPCRSWIIFAHNSSGDESVIIPELLDRGFPVPRIFQGVGANLYEFSDC